MISIPIAHAGAHYEVVVASLAEALPRLEALGSGSLLPVVSDRRVFDLYGQLLAGIGIPDPVLVPEGEAAKDWATLADVVGQLARLNVMRGTPIVTLGGGSVGDIAGLAASVFKRGCPIVHIPTTLLAQADSAIGGKTAIDAAGQKNLVGTFHHPLLVIVDPGLLETLDARQLRSGYAEVVKYGLIDDAQFFTWCEANGQKLLSGDPMARCAAVEHCIRAKARFVTADPDDSLGHRALLNFGHTFGHAIEAAAGDALLHGEAVAIGMVMAYRFSAQLGLCPTEDARRLEAHLQTLGLPTALVGLDPKSVFQAMQGDKKATPSGLTLILTRGIGQAFMARDVDSELLFDFLVRQG